MLLGPRLSIFLLKTFCFRPNKSCLLIRSLAFNWLSCSSFMQDHYVKEQSENKDSGPLLMNAFEMITLSQGLNLSVLFDRQQVDLFSLQLIINSRRQKKSMAHQLLIVFFFPL